MVREPLRVGLREAHDDLGREPVAVHVRTLARAAAACPRTLGAVEGSREERIDALEREVAELQARLARLERSARPGATTSEQAPGPAPARPAAARKPAAPPREPVDLGREDAEGDDGDDVGRERPERVHERRVAEALGLHHWQTVPLGGLLYRRRLELQPAAGRLVWHGDDGDGRQPGRDERVE